MCDSSSLNVLVLTVTTSLIGLMIIGTACINAYRRGHW